VKRIAIKFRDHGSELYSDQGIATLIEWEMMRRCLLEDGEPVYELPKPKEIEVQAAVVARIFSPKTPFEQACEEARRAYYSGVLKLKDFDPEQAQIRRRRASILRSRLSLSSAS